MLRSSKFGEWEIYADEEDYDLETGERYTFPVKIGEEIKADGSREPVLEYIYSDILAGAYDGTYSTSVSMGRIPAVIFKYGGEIIDHNENMPLFKEDILKALEEIPYKLRMKAIVAAAPMGHNATIPKASPATDVLLLVCAHTGTRYNADMVMGVLRESVKNHEIFRSPVKDRLIELKKNDLLELVGEIKILRLTGSSSNELLNSLISEFGEEKVVCDIAWEIADREFIKGHL